MTEAEVLELLRVRHARHGNGGAGEYAFLTHVRNGAGFEANRTFDAVAVNLWPSKHLDVTIFEVKVSRSDWLRELKDPTKSGAALELADFFTVVAPVDCVKPDELPDRWGLIEVRPTLKHYELRSKVQPKRITVVPHWAQRHSRSLPRAFVVGMLRACPGAIPGGKRDIPPRPVDIDEPLAL